MPRTCFGDLQTADCKSVGIHVAAVHAHSIPRPSNGRSVKWRSDTGPGWLALPFHCRCSFVTQGPKPVDVRATQAAILHRNIHCEPLML